MTVVGDIAVAASQDARHYADLIVREVTAYGVLRAVIMPDSGEKIIHVRVSVQGPGNLAQVKQLGDNFARNLRILLGRHHPKTEIIGWVVGDERRGEVFNITVYVN